MGEISDQYISAGAKAEKGSQANGRGEADIRCDAYRPDGHPARGNLLGLYELGFPINR